MIRLSQNIFSQLPTKTQLFIGAEFKAVVVGLDHHGLIYKLIFSCHRGTTFYTLLWKAHILQAIGLNPLQDLRFFVLKWNNISPKLGINYIFAFQNGWANILKRSLWNEWKSFLYYFLIWRAITNRYPPINSILHNVIW